MRLLDFIVVVSLAMQHSLVELACVFFMDCSVFLKIWLISLISHETDFRFENFFPAVIAEFEAAGRKVEIKKKEKRNRNNNVESAFLKDNTDVYNLTFQTEKSVKIKIEVDTHPPLVFQTEQRLSLLPFSFMTRCMTLSCLFAGKMHALVYRAWNNRVKGRDWYDFEWYVRKGVHLDFRHLQERIRQFGGGEVSLEEFKEKLRERLATADIKQVKNDVRDFLINPSEMDIWSNEYFLQLSEMMQID